MLELLRKYRIALMAAFLLLVALLLYSANLRHRERTTLFERTVLALTLPLDSVLARLTGEVSGWWQNYVWLIGTRQENQRLLAENRRLQGELYRLEEARLANERLRRLLEFKETLTLPTLPAEVISEDASSWFRTVAIDKGSSDGLREGLPVVVAEGVVGRIIRVTPHQARVLLITDASSAAAALVQESRARGVCRGQGDHLVLEFALNREAIAAGDRIVTSGTGGVFPKGLVLGSVATVSREAYGLFQSVSVTPAVDFSRLEEVLVLLPKVRP